GLTHDLALAVQDAARAFLHRNVDTDVVHGWSSGLMRRCTVARQDPSILAEQEPARRNDPILVTETEPTTPIAKPGRHLDHHLDQHLEAVLEASDVPNLAAAAALRDGYRDGRLVHVQSDKVISSIRPVPMLEALCRSSGTTLDSVQSRTGADHSADIGARYHG